MRLPQCGPFTLMCWKTLFLLQLQEKEVEVFQQDAVPHPSSKFIRAALNEMLQDGRGNYFICPQI
jgi:hypothetical protein